MTLRNVRRRLLALSVLLLLAPLWRQTVLSLSAESHPVQFARFDLECDALLIGCALALAQYDTVGSRLLAHKLMRSGVMAVLIIMGALCLIHNDPLKRLVALIGVALFINGTSRPRGDAWGRMLNYRPVVWFGQMSYSIYLWQQIFCWKSRIPWVGIFPLNVGVTILFAAVSFYLIEKPLAKMRSRIIQGSAVVRDQHRILASMNSRRTRDAVVETTSAVS